MQFRRASEHAREVEPGAGSIASGAGSSGKEKEWPSFAFMFRVYMSAQRRGPKRKWKKDAIALAKRQRGLQLYFTLVLLVKVPTTNQSHGRQSCGGWWPKISIGNNQLDLPVESPDGDDEFDGVVGKVKEMSQDVRDVDRQRVG